jgi:hypothetical protein
MGERNSGCSHCNLLLRAVRSIPTEEEALMFQARSLWRKRRASASVAKLQDATNQETSSRNKLISKADALFNACSNLSDWKRLIQFVARFPHEKPQFGN